ncbi:oxidoreductase, partial [Enterobacter mori]
MTLVEDVDQSIWYKLLVNLAINTVTALSRQTAQVLKVEGIQTLCERLLQEGVKIAQAEGVIFHQDVISEIMT